ncbi:MAG: hypothetical protein Q4F10_12245 [Corynebacterium glutamicum]|nr:hypothetical protein [Corynebacterium glutamicum]
MASTALKYPRWKILFDALTVIGLMLMLAKLVIVLSGNAFNVFPDSVLYAVLPVSLTIIGATGSHRLRQKTT